MPLEPRIGSLKLEQYSTQMTPSFGEVITDQIEIPLAPMREFLNSAIYNLALDFGNFDEFDGTYIP